MTNPRRLVRFPTSCSPCRSLCHRVFRPVVSNSVGFVWSTLAATVDTSDSLPTVDYDNVSPADCFHTHGRHTGSVGRHIDFVGRHIGSVGRHFVRPWDEVVDSATGAHLWSEFDHSGTVWWFLISEKKIFLTFHNALQLCRTFFT